MSLAPRDGTASADEFWVMDLSKEGATTPDHLRIFYAWSRDGAWEVTDNPRLHFANASALYKLYGRFDLIDRECGPHPPTRIRPSPLDFLRQFLPELEDSIKSG